MIATASIVNRTSKIPIVLCHCELTRWLIGRSLSVPYVVFVLCCHLTANPQNIRNN